MYGHPELPSPPAPFDYQELDRLLARFERAERAERRSNLRADWAAAARAPERLLLAVPRGHQPTPRRPTYAVFHRSRQVRLYQRPRDAS